MKTCRNSGRRMHKAHVQAKRELVQIGLHHLEQKNGDAPVTDRLASWRITHLAATAANPSGFTLSYFF